MKKIVILTSTILSTVWMSLALTSNDLKNSLNNSYNTSITNWTNVYNKYKNIISNINNNISTWDYKILSELTGVSTSNLNNNIKNNYTNLIKTITTDKLNIVWKTEINQTNFNNNFVTTWEYNNNLNNIQSEISWYILNENSNIKNFESSISREINNFNNDLKNKLNTYKTNISNYKDFKNKLEILNKNYNKLIQDNDKLNKTIWVWKEILNKKSEELKKYVINYYSWMLNNEFQNYLKQDNNMTYYQDAFWSKKEVLLWFLNNKLINIISNIIKTYYPDVNIQETTDWMNLLKEKWINEIIENYNELIIKVSNLQNTITTNHNKINEKLNKLWNSQDTINIYKILKDELIKELDTTVKIIKEDTKQTLKNYFEIIKNKKKAEQPIMTQLMVNYNTKMSEDTLTWLNTFEATLNNYKNIIVLPQNLDILNKYIKAVKTEIENLKLKWLTDQLKNIKNDIKNIQISNNFNKINKLSWKIAKLENTVPERFKKELEQDKYLLQIKGNLNKLFKIWAIRYYYKNWDLTDVVANILTKYYNKYKANNKESIFNEKINKAFEKIQILEDSLQNDKRSYYIIMIHNGLLKFKSNLLK